MSNHAGSVLIVDDQPANLAVLSKMLGDEGYKVRAVTSGERALESARLAPPDCILLDVAMPGMDGYTTCEALLEEASLAETPIIFLTAFDDTDHKIRGFRAGGRDYVSKPFQAEEVIARVSSQMKVAQLQRELRTQNANLVEANAKLQEIGELKSRMTAMLVHDVRSPLLVLGCILDGQLDERARKDAELAYRKIDGLLRDMLELSRSEQALPAPGHTAIDLGEVLGRVVSASRHVAADKAVKLLYEPLEAPLLVTGDASKLDRVFSNLIDNALKFTPAGGDVRVRVAFEEGAGVESGMRFLAVSVVDTGPGIPPEDLPYVFDPYRQTAAGRDRGGFGLGLSITQRLVAEHRGRIQVRSRPGVGTEFRVLLPL